jgi:hypothetical protein
MTGNVEQINNNNICSFKENRMSSYLLGKTPLSKKAHQKRLMSIEQSLMAGPNCQAGQGKGGTAQSLGEQWLL